MSVISIWIAIGCCFIALDLLLMSVVSCLFGVSALILACIIYLTNPISIHVHIIIWCILCALMVIIWFLVKKYFFNQQKLDKAINQVGYMVKYDPHANLGVVRFTIPVLNQEEWQCKSKDNVSINPENRVRVVAVDNKNKVLIVENQ